MPFKKVLLSPNLEGTKKKDNLVLLNRDIETLLGKEKLRKFKITILNNKEIDINKDIKNVSYVNLIYEKILKEIVPELNAIHKKKWSVRSWRVFIGPWLNRYITIINQRIEDIKPLLKERNIKFIKRKNYSLLTENIDDFTKKSMNIAFNEKLYLEIYKLHKKKINIYNPGFISQNTSLKVKKFNFVNLKKK